MKLSFSYIDSIGGFLSVATVATLLLSHPIRTFSKTPQNLAHIAIVIPLKLDSVVRDNSVERLVKGCINILYFCKEEDVLASSSEPSPPPPVTERSGGSR